jgi:hypothetical protein
VFRGQVKARGDAPSRLFLTSRRRGIDQADLPTFRGCYGVGKQLVSQHRQPATTMAQVIQASREDAGTPGSNAPSLRTQRAPRRDLMRCRTSHGASALKRSVEPKMNCNGQAGILTPHGI